jgi:hypothetical protein
MARSPPTVGRFGSRAAFPPTLAAPTMPAVVPIAATTSGAAQVVNAVLLLETIVTN